MGSAGVAACTLANHLETRIMLSRLRRTARPTLERLEDRTVPTLLGNSLFPADNPWNQAIANAPVAGNSAAIMNNIITTYGNGKLHPDFGQDYNNSGPLYGIPYNVVHGNSTPKVHVVIDAYASESDLQDAPIPANAVIEGDLQNGPTVGVNNRGDSHLIVYDVDNNIGYEFYRASRPSENSDGQWHADQESIWNYNTDEFRTLGYTSADAAGLAILPGLVRPDEGLPTSQGGQGIINHAIRFTLQNSMVLNQFIYPASHTANPGNNNAAIQPPMGTRFRLKTSVDISTLNPESRVIAQAMKDYGLILADNGSNFFFTGASYSVNASNAETLTWNDNDIQDSVHGLKSLPFSDFEVVDLTPVVTGLSEASGAAGDAITIAGQNFSGAAGHLQVLFGNTAATNVTVTDDAHVTATVPAGSGTVDVRVQSGVADPNDSSNIKSPIFGYGTSVVTPADQFSYSGGGSDAPPTVVTPAAASPSTVTGKTTALSVLGGDDDGEASLIYTWSVTSAPAGAHPTFSANGTNAAKNTTVTFDHAGAYTFVVTITDPSALSVTSNVSVSVVQTVTSITLTPTTVTVAPGGKVAFSATAYDQFSLVMTQQPAFTWKVISGRGKISSTGVYTAPNTTGTAMVQVSAGGVKATATVYIKKAGTLARKALTRPFGGVGRDV
jgi:plastocyanin